MSALESAVIAQLHPDGAAILRDVFDYLGRFVVYPSMHAQVAHTPHDVLARIVNQRGHVHGGALAAALERAGWSLSKEAAVQTVATKVRTPRTPKATAQPRKREPAMSTQKKKPCRQCLEPEPVKAASALPPPSAARVDAAADLDMEALVNEFAAASIKDRKRT